MQGLGCHGAALERRENGRLEAGAPHACEEILATADADMVPLAELAVPLGGILDGRLVGSLAQSSLVW